MSTEVKLIPIFASRGEIGAFLHYPYIFNTFGEWIGWVSPERDVFAVNGMQVGILSDGPRILRKREWNYDQPKRKSPDPPGNIQVPSQLPLSPQLPEVANNMIDVLDEAPDLLPTADFGDLWEDMD